MGQKNHPKMPVSQRAKQFMPFDALPGFRDALRRKEYEMGLTGKKALSEESEEEVNEALESLAAGDMIKVTYYRKEDVFDGGAYVTAEGNLLKIDTVFHTLTIECSGDAAGSGMDFDEIEIEVDDIEKIELI